MFFSRNRLICSSRSSTETLGVSEGRGGGGGGGNRLISPSGIGYRHFIVSFPGSH